MMNRILAAGVAIAMLTSCEPGSGGPNKEQIGTIAGGIGGAFAGSNLGKGSGRTVGIAAGTLLGAFIGNQIGASLDRADQAYYSRTVTSALESNKTNTSSSWTNPDSGNSGTITPTKTYTASSGQPCREFSQTVSIGGKSQQAYGTACRQGDGSWKIVQ